MLDWLFCNHHQHKVQHLKGPTEQGHYHNTNQYVQTIPLPDPMLTAQRPDIYAPSLYITRHDDSLITPGYIFLAPYQTFQAGIYIYDNRGNLVYSGFAATGGGPSHNFHVCDAGGTDRLCYITGSQNDGYVRGYGIVMDDTFTTTTSIKSGGGVANFDEHEFNVVDDGKNVLMTLYNPQPYDMSAWNVTNGQGWIINCFFQKLEIGTNRLLFEWSSLDHVSPNQSFVLPDSTEVSGNGFNPTLPWDYFHINSVDQFANGDYLISARHVSCIYRISGVDGSVLWRLGGMASDFTFPHGLNFSFQHDARIREETKSHLVISLFDNASNGYNGTASMSSGKILQLDLDDMKVSLLYQYYPINNIVSASQGNVQLIPSGIPWDKSNVFIGWGENAYISEYTTNGTLVQQGYFALTGTMNYRAFKYNYTTNPADAPALFTYAHNESASTIFYMSWNGATKVDRWRIYGSDSRNGSWTMIDTVDKQGFETTFRANEYYAWGMVESLDVAGKPLRNNTRPTQTFVPGEILAKSCNEYSCDTTNRYVAPASTTASWQSNAKNAASQPRKRNEGFGFADYAMLGFGVAMIS